MRFLFCFMIGFFFFGTKTLAYGQEELEASQETTQIDKPLREDRLKALLPIIQGIYANTDTYTARRQSGSSTIYSGPKNPPHYTYYGKVKDNPLEAISLQNLHDTAQVIDFLRERPASTHFYEHVRTNPKRNIFPSVRHERFAYLWPDNINFVKAADSSSCDNFCGSLLHERSFTSITIIAAEVSPDQKQIKKTNAIRYSLDQDGCFLSLNSSPRQCILSEDVSIPTHGAFVYFNHVSPFWPSEYERTASKKKYNQSPNLVALSYNLIYPKAFQSLETDFELTHISHLSYELRAKNREPVTIFAYEASCIKPLIPLNNISLNLLISTDEPQKNVSNSLIIARDSKGICSERHLNKFNSPIPRWYSNSKKSFDIFLRDKASTQAYREQLISKIGIYSEDYKSTKNKNNIYILKRSLETLDKSDLSQAQMDIVIQGYAPMFDDAINANWAFNQIKQFPEGSLSRHINTLNSFRDKILEQSGCNEIGCGGRYKRNYQKSPSLVIDTKTRNENDTDRQWLKLAGDAAGIYAAAGPNAVKDLEAAHERGLGGAIYALGCLGTGSERIEAFAAESKESWQTYPQRAIRHFLSLRHSSKSEEYKSFLASDRIIDRYSHALDRALLVWDNDTSLCMYRSEI